MNKYIHKYYAIDPNAGGGSDNPSDDQVTPSKPKYLTRKEAIIKGENLTPMSRSEAMLKKEDIPVFTRKESLIKEALNSGGSGGSYEELDFCGICNVSYSTESDYICEFNYVVKDEVTSLISPVGSFGLLAYPYTSLEDAINDDGIESLERLLKGTQIMVGRHGDNSTAIIESIDFKHIEFDDQMAVTTIVDDPSAGEVVANYGGSLAAITLLKPQTLVVVKLSPRG